MDQHRGKPISIIGIISLHLLMMTGVYSWYKQSSATRIRNSNVNMSSSNKNFLQRPCKCSHARLGWSQQHEPSQLRCPSMHSNQSWLRFLHWFVPLTNSPAEQHRWSSLCIKSCCQTNLQKKSTESVHLSRSALHFSFFLRTLREFRQYPDRARETPILKVQQWRFCWVYTRASRISGTGHLEPVQLISIASAIRAIERAEATLTWRFWPPQRPQTFTRQ